MNRPGIQAWIGVFLVCGAIGWRWLWVGVATLGLLVYLDAMIERWRIVR